jgi:hypothetical protein
MKLNFFASIAVFVSLVFISGCVGYSQPYQGYSAGYVAPHPAVIPYGGYNYGGYGGFAPHPLIEHERMARAEPGRMESRPMESGRSEKSYGAYRRHAD